MCKAVENVRLEFKRDVPGRDETLKKLSSFAKTFGGQVILGAKADVPGFGSAIASQNCELN